MKQKFYEELLQEFNQFTQIGQLLSFWYQKTSCPAVIVNSSFSVIASAGLNDNAHGECFSKYLFYGGIITDDFKRNINHALEQRGQAFCQIEKRKISIKALRINVKYDSLILIVLIDPRTNSLNIEEKLECLKGAVHTFLTIYTQRFDSKEVFLKELIEGKIADETQAGARARDLFVAVKSNRPVCLLVGRINHKEEKIRKDICRYLSVDLFPSSCVLDRSDEIVLLLFDHSLVERDSQNIQKMKWFLKEVQGQFVICPPTHKFQVVAGQYQEARDMLQMLSERNLAEPVVFFEQYVFPLMLGNLSREELNVLCIPSIQQLYEQDQINKTDKALMLYAYLVCFGNYSEIAELMEISYSTAKSRVIDLQPFFFERFEKIAPSYYLSLKILGFFYPEFGAKCDLLGAKARGIKR